MIEHLRQLNDKDAVLVKFDEQALNQLYLRVFQSADGELLLQDLANRLHVYNPPTNDFESGQYSAYVSIISRLRNAVAIKEVQSE